jgi:flagellar basal-body rod protein FlgG
MMRALWTAATGMEAQQLHIDTIANNLANVNTHGFKKSRIDFEDLLYQTIREPGGTVAAGLVMPTGIQVGLGVKTAAIAKDFAQGAFEQTENPLDMAIEGNGFFRLLMPDGSIAYTRDGAFKLDNTGRVVSSDGFPLDPEIVIPEGAQSISVGTDGTVSVMVAGSTTPDEVGQVQISTFLNPSGLRSVGKNNYLPSGSSGEPLDGSPGDEGFGVVMQGFLESSNVQIVDEMVAMIVAQRAFETNSRAIQAADEMLSIANSIRR